MNGKGERRSLSQTGGESERHGDETLARRLARAMDVDPDEALAFTHGFHAYPARMHPTTAGRLIEDFATRDGVVYDPFVGSGTTAVEAMIRDLEFIGGDLSPVAVEIAWARTRVLPRVVLEGVLRAARDIVRRAREGPPDADEQPEWARRVQAWFVPRVLRELVDLDLWIAQLPGEELRRLFRVVVSSLLVKLSRQVSDSVTLKDDEHRPAPPGAVFRAFHDRARELVDGLRALAAHRRSCAMKRGVVIERADARTGPPASRAIRLIVTSPPYPGTYDYARHHELRFEYLGFKAEEVSQNEIGSRAAARNDDREAAAYKEAMTAVVAAWRKVLAPRGYAAVLIGDGYVGRRLIDARDILSDAAAKAGLNVAASVSQPRREWSPENRGKWKKEHLVLLAVHGKSSPGPA